MTDDDGRFLNEFESLQLDPIEFNHIGHLRLAYLYVERDGVETAVQQVSKGIRAFAENLGAKNKYHQTITEALVRLIAIRWQQSPTPDWQTFLTMNTDLVDNAYGVLLRYYTPERLKSNEARQQFLTPDRQSWEA